MISCSECRQCNRKGKPSVLRGSKYCNEHIITVKRKSVLFKWVDNIKDKIMDKRLDKDGKLTTSKGFRQSWWYR